MSSHDLRQAVNDKTKFPSELVDLTLQFNPMTCLFVAEKISVPTSDPTMPPAVHWSAGTFFSKRKAILYFSKIGSYNRILRSRRIGEDSPFRYQLLGFLLEPERKVKENELIPIVDVAVSSKSHFKGLIGLIRRSVKRFPFLKEISPYDNSDQGDDVSPGKYQHLYSWISRDGASWKYIVCQYHTSGCRCGCRPTNLSERQGMSNLAHFGWD